MHLVLTIVLMRSLRVLGFLVPVTLGEGLPHVVSYLFSSGRLYEFVRLVLLLASLSMIAVYLFGVISLLLKLLLLALTD